MRVWRGPFRGARIVMNPRCSLRKVFGLYEHELNGWLELALRRVTRVIDVGANDGYFTFGCAAAFRRLGVQGEIIGFEPEGRFVHDLRRSVRRQDPGVRFDVVQALVSAEVGRGVTTLDMVSATDRESTLIKIDVEGAEMDVLAGATSWMNPSNFFLIEVHKHEFLDPLRQTFVERGLSLRQVDQRPLPLLRSENRATANWWLVSDLGP